MNAPIYTYCATQATNCAVCGQHRHTPLRVDHMGGYVCLSCIDGELHRKPQRAFGPVADVVAHPAHRTEFVPVITLREGHGLKHGDVLYSDADVTRLILAWTQIMARKGAVA